MKNAIKRLIILAAFGLAFALNGHAQGDKLIDKYENTDGVMALSLSGNFFNNAVDDASDEVKDALQKLGTIKMLIAEDVTTAPIAEMRKEVKLYTSGKDFKDVLKIKSDGNVIDFKFKPSGKAKGEIVMVVDSPDAFVTLFIDGEFDFNDAKKIAKELQSNNDIGLGI